MNAAGDGYSFKYFPDYRQHARFDASGERLEGVYFDDPDVPSSVSLGELSSGQVGVYVPDHIKRGLESSVQAEHRDWSAEQQAAWAARAIGELERTPPVPWIQQNFWPVHHGDFCTYIGEWDQARLVQEAHGMPATEFLAQLVRAAEGIENLDQVWEGLGNGAVTVFMFECPTCGTRIGIDQSY